MNLKKVVLIICIVFMAVMLFSGCKYKGSFNLSKPETAKTDFHKGTNGLTMGFVKNMPPEEIWHEGKFKVGIMFRNRGASDITQGVFTLSGYDNYYMNMMGVEEKMSFTTDSGKLEGMSQYNPEGGFITIAKSGKNVKVPRRSKEYLTLFKARACYMYETKASVDVCINPNVFNSLEIKGGCDVRDITVGGGQGAPVAITKVEEDIIPRGGDLYEVRFNIFLSNKGNGDVKKYNDGKCVGESLIDISKVEFSDYSTKASTHDKKISCTPSKSFELKSSGKENMISCTAMVEQSKGAFKTPFVITLRYGYTSSITTKVKVKRIPGIDEEETLADKECKDENDNIRNDAYDCGDNKVCYHGQCVSKCDVASELYNLEEGFESGFKCQKIENCVAESIIKGFCPGEVDNVCCESKTFVCEGRDNGDLCGENLVCYKGLCISECEYCSEGNYGSRVSCGAVTSLGWSCQNPEGKEFVKYLCPGGADSVCSKDVEKPKEEKVDEQNKAIEEVKKGADEEYKEGPTKLKCPKLCKKTQTCSYGSQTKDTSKYNIPNDNICCLYDKANCVDAEKGKDCNAFTAKACIEGQLCECYGWKWSNCKDCDGGSYCFTYQAGNPEWNAECNQPS